MPRHVLVLEPTALAQLLRSGRSNQLFEGQLAHEGRVLDASVRLRGAWARSWSKKSFKVRFAGDALLDDRDRINLNSCGRDRAWIREPLAYEIYRDSGTIASRSHLVRLDVNGDFWGIFVDVEQPKAELLRRHGLDDAILFKADSDANRADERAFESAETYRIHYELETGVDEERSGDIDRAYAHLAAFCEGLAAADDPRAIFESQVDLPRYVNYLCATAIVQNWDGFNKNHFIAYDVHGTQKWSVLPWDLDRTLGDHWHWNFDETDVPAKLGTRRLRGATGWNRMADRFFSDPRLERLFWTRLAELVDTVFTEERMLARVDALESVLQPVAERDRRRWGGSRDGRRAIEEVRDFVRGRRKHLLGEIDRARASGLVIPPKGPVSPKKSGAATDSKKGD